MISASAPGKLYVAGEHAVVEPGHPAILVAVDRFVTVSVAAHSAAEPPSAATGNADSPGYDGGGRIFSDRYPSGPRHFRRAEGRIVPADGGDLDYVISAIAVVDELRAAAGLEPGEFDLRIESTLDEADGRKYGLGSSGAVAVATVSALSAWYGLELDRHDIFRAALLATIAVSPNASGGDIAASTYRGWVRYVSPDRGVLRQQVDERGCAWTLRSGNWGSCEIRPLGEPAGLGLHVGWTGAPASTNALVAHVRRPDSAAAAEYARFLEANGVSVEALTAAWGSDPARVRAEIGEVRQQLRALGKAAGAELETPALARLCEVAEAHGAAAKLAGAGGGDCGIALAGAEVDVAAMRAEWERDGIRPLELGVAAPRAARAAEPTDIGGG